MSISDLLNTILKSGHFLPGHRKFLELVMYVFGMQLFVQSAYLEDELRIFFRNEWLLLLFLESSFYQPAVLLGVEGPFFLTVPAVPADQTRQPAETDLLPAPSAE